MIYIKRYALVPYSTEQMFNLINDINSYSKFIPGCIDSVILNKKDNELTAKMYFSKSNVSASLITNNCIINNKVIIIRLVEGPFKNFIGSWYFISLNNKLSKIEFKLNFEFKNTFIELLFRPIFKEVLNNTLITFTERAKEIYCN